MIPKRSLLSSQLRSRSKSNDQWSVDLKLRAYIDASGTCEDRKAFYNALKSSGPKAAYDLYSKRVGINLVWLPTIREILDVEES
jgi:hypothetical protein